MHQDEPYEEGDQVEGAGIHQKLASEDSILSTQKLKDVNLKHEDMPTDDDLETFRIFFELFDRDRSGYIDGGDLAAISAKLGKNPTEGKTAIHSFCNTIFTLSFQLDRKFRHQPGWKSFIWRIRAVFVVPAEDG